MATTGKNEACHCGSGMTYGECCYAEDVSSDGHTEAENKGHSILSQLENRAFSSLEEAREAAKRLTDSYNRAPLDDFCGLSPEEMFHFLHHPFNFPNFVSFNGELQRFPDSAFFRLFNFLMNSLGKDKLKATATGMLPVKLVREAALSFYGEEAYRDRQRYMTYRTETDFPVLHTVRLVAELSGFMRKFKGRFQLTKEGAALAERGMDGAAFRRIFEAHTRKFNWAYNDRYPELHIIQQAFLFTLYVLSRFGGDFRPASFYEDLFLKAFPHALSSIPELPYETPDKTVKRCFSIRSLSRFGHFFGFLELDGPEKTRWIEKRSIKKTEFLDECVRFRQHRGDK